MQQVVSMLVSICQKMVFQISYYTAIRATSSLLALEVDSGLYHNLLTGSRSLTTIYLLGQETACGTHSHVITITSALPVSVYRIAGKFRGVKNSLFSWAG